MGGSVIDTTRSKTTIQLDVPTPATSRWYNGPTLPAIDLVSVYPGDPTSAVVVDLKQMVKRMPSDGGGYREDRTAVFSLTRDEAFNVIRALQRALGIDPDALVRALESVEASTGSEMVADEDVDQPGEPLYALDDLYEAASRSIGRPMAGER